MKDGNGMKLYELTINEHGVHFRYANPHPLTANQKFGIIMSVIGVISIIGPFVVAMLA